MAALLDNVGFTVGNTPGTGVINVGTVLTDATNGDYQLPAAAGAVSTTVYNWRAIDGNAWMNFTGTYTTGTPNTITFVALIKSSTGSQLSLTSAAKIFGVIFGQNGNDFNINSADDFTITSGNSKLTVSNNNGSKLTYFGTSGWFAGANTSAVGPGGQSVFMSSAGYFGLNCALTWGSLASSPDVYLQRDAAGTLAQKNGLNSQTFRLYGTYTGSADAWAEFNHSTSGNLTISTQKNGSGAAGDINIKAANGIGGGIVIPLNNYSFTASSNGSTNFGVSNSGLVFVTGNIRIASFFGGTDGADIARNTTGLLEINNGTLGSCRDLKLRTAFHVAGTTAQAQINLASGVAPTSPADGDIWYDGAGLKLRTGGSTVAIGGATSTPDPYTLSSQYGGL